MLPIFAVRIRIARLLAVVGPVEGLRCGENITEVTGQCHLMITKNPEEFLTTYGGGKRSCSESPPTLRAALLVSPTGFRISEQSASDNHYMSTAAAVDHGRAHAQHAGLVAKLEDLGIPVLLFPGRPGLDDGVFPNNAFATTPGKLLLGAMRHTVRQAETQREDIRTLFRDAFRYKICDLSALDGVAELTGPLVIDRARRLGFCGLGSRADAKGCEAMHQAFGLDLTLGFDLQPTEYHANLVLAILAGRFCVIHPESFLDPDVPETIARVYPGHTLVLSNEEKQAFAGNCIAVTESDVLFSATALKSLRASSRDALERAEFRVHEVPVDELEKGGGSLRCLIAEIF